MAWVDTIVASLLEYQTVKTLRIKSKKVGAIFRLLQLAIIAYVIGFAIIYKKGYQEQDIAVSSIITKVKGTTSTCRVPVANMTMCNTTDIRVWDTTDYVIPAQENNAVFIMTNFIEIEQTQNPNGWDEDPGAPTTGSTKVWKCNNDTDCPYLASSRNGVLNGQCNTTTHICRIYGWGPVETIAADNSSALIGYPNFLNASYGYTVFVKNSILFPNFDATFGNIGLTSSSINSCIYSPSDPYCPVYTVGTMTDHAGITNFTSAMVAGAVIGVELTYNCDLDQDKHKCKPDIRFTRIDRDTQLSPGYNFRYAYYSMNEEGQRERDLYKAFGIRFIFIVSGTAGRFSIIPLLVALGSGLGLLGVATILADIIVTKFLADSTLYADHKYQELTEEDEKRFERSHEKSPLIDVNG